jgi:hypothetical protein
VPRLKSVVVSLKKDQKVFFVVRKLPAGAGRSGNVQLFLQKMPTATECRYDGGDGKVLSSICNRSLPRICGDSRRNEEDNQCRNTIRNHGRPYGRKNHLAGEPRRDAFPARRFFLPYGPFPPCGASCDATPSRHAAPSRHAVLSPGAVLSLRKDAYRALPLLFLCASSTILAVRCCAPLRETNLPTDPAPKQNRRYVHTGGPAFREGAVYYCTTTFL